MESNTTETTEHVENTASIIAELAETIGRHQTAHNKIDELEHEAELAATQIAVLEEELRQCGVDPSTVPELQKYELYWQH